MVAAGIYQAHVREVDSLDNVGEHSNSANTGEPSEAEKDHIPVSRFPTKNNVPLALRSLINFNVPGKL